MTTPPLPLALALAGTATLAALLAWSALTNHPDLEGRVAGALADRAEAFREAYGPAAVVFGASKGIGAAWVRALARRGLDVILVARGADALRATVRDASAEFPSSKFEVIEADFADVDATRALARGLAARGGPQSVGFVVYNAALLPMGPHLAHPHDTHERTVRVNVLSPLAVVDEMAPALVARKRGAIVLMSSVSGEGGASSGGLYSATKSWTTIFAESLWVQLRASGVDVLASCPGITATPTLDAVARPDKRNAAIEGDPRDVVEASLKALGRGPVVYPGAIPKIVAWLQWLLPARVRLPASTAVEDTYRSVPELVLAAKRG